MSPEVSAEETEHEWYQEMYESLPKALFDGRVKNIKTTTMDIIKYTFDNEPCYIPYDELWDCHLENPRVEHVELFEKFISEKTHLTQAELDAPQYWSFHPQLGMIAHFPRGDYERTVPVKRVKKHTLVPRTLDFNTDFSISYKGSIIVINNTHPCPTPSSVFSNGIEPLLESLGMVDTHQWKAVISESSPILMGNGDSINKLISEGNRHPNTHVFSLDQIHHIVEGRDNG